MSVPIKIKRKRRQKDIVFSRQTRNRINAEMKNYSAQASISEAISPQAASVTEGPCGKNDITSFNVEQANIRIFNPDTSAATVVNYLTDDVDEMVDPVVCFNPSNENTFYISVPSAGIDQLFDKDPSSEDVFDDAVSQIILSDDEEDEVGLEYQSAIDWSSYSNSEEEDNSSFQTIPVAVEDDETAVKNKIAEWVVSCRIPHLHVNSLLRILKTHANLQYLPLDTRTLLKSKREKLLFIDVPPGKYYHIGVEPLLIAILLELKSQENTLSESLLEGHYGLEIYRPHLSGKRVAVSVTGMSSDAPATTFLLNLSTHNAYYGCRKCNEASRFSPQTSVFLKL